MYSKMNSLAVIILALTGTLRCADAILSKAGESKDIGKSSESTKKSDSLEAQASHHHAVYGGYGDNGLGGFGDSGFGGGYGTGGDVGFGGGSYGGYDEHHNHKHHDHHHHHDDHHHHHDDSFHKALAIKGLLVPLAGVALLGAAAAFVSNPILLQLGVISGSYVGAGRRRRREVEEELALNQSAAQLEVQERLKEIKTLERFMAQVPKEEMFSQEKKLMASYLSCSGTSDEACLERLACELQGPGANNMPEETRVMSIVTNEIFSNELVPYKTKEKMAEALRRGKEGQDCSVFRCRDLEALIRQNENKSQ